MEKQPDGFKILKTLIELYADQEGIEIKYEIEKGGDNDETDTGKLLFAKS